MLLCRNKNIYVRSKGKESSSIAVKKGIEKGTLLAFEDLKEEDEEEDVIMGCAGLSNALWK